MSLEDHILPEHHHLAEQHSLVDTTFVYSNTVSWTPLSHVKHYLLDTIISSAQLSSEHRCLQGSTVD